MMICSVYKKTSTAAPQTSSTSTTTAGTTSSTAGSTSSTTQGTTQATTTSGSTGLIVSTEARCGTSEIDAREHCGVTCKTNRDCPSGQYCWGVYDNCKLWNNRYSHLSSSVNLFLTFFIIFLSPLDCGSIPKRVYSAPVQSTQWTRCGKTVTDAWTFCGQEVRYAISCQFFIHIVAWHILI